MAKYGETSIFSFLNNFLKETLTFTLQTPILMLVYGLEMQKLCQKVKKTRDKKNCKKWKFIKWFFSWLRTESEISVFQALFDPFVDPGDHFRCQLAIFLGAAKPHKTLRACLKNLHVDQIFSVDCWIISEVFDAQVVHQSWKIFFFKWLAQEVRQLPQWRL